MFMLNLEFLYRITGVKTRMGVGLGLRCMSLRLCPSPVAGLELKNGVGYKFSQRWVKVGMGVGLGLRCLSLRLCPSPLCHI
jgi:hypothetical protein